MSASRNWIPARRFKRPDEFTLRERLSVLWGKWPLVSQETANAEHLRNPESTVWALDNAARRPVDREVTK